MYEPVDVCHSTD